MNARSIKLIQFPYEILLSKCHDIFISNFQYDKNMVVWVEAAVLDDPLLAQGQKIPEN